MKDKKAFTLAETMIVLVILGIVAAITIPALVRRHVESSNRTRIRKAMAVYDTAINKMVVENGIKSNDALINEFNADKNNNSCAKSRAYFKTSQDGANDCTFRASDGVWWNISDINHPIIAFNEDDLNKADEENNKAFKLVGYLDDNGSLRVSDLAKAEGDNKEYLTKLYGFVVGVNNAQISNIKLIPNYTDTFKTDLEKYFNGEFGECENPNGTWNCTNCISCIHKGRDLVFDSTGNVMIDNSNGCISGDGCTYVLVNDQDTGVEITGAQRVGEQVCKDHPTISDCETASIVIKSVTYRNNSIENIDHIEYQSSKVDSSSDDPVYAYDCNSNGECSKCKGAWDAGYGTCIALGYNCPLNSAGNPYGSVVCTK